MSQSKASAWSEAEDELLLHWQTKLGNKWAAIAKLIPGHSGPQCAQRWRRKVANRPWGPKDDAALTELVAKHGDDWAEISRRLSGWTSKQCSDRWRLQLAPNTKKATPQWSAEEDERLAQLYAQFGSAWSALAKGLGQHRTHQQCRARWLRLHNEKITKNKASTSQAATTTPLLRCTRASQRAAALRAASQCSSRGSAETSTSVAPSDTSTSDAESQQATQTVLKPQKKGSMVLGRRSIRYPTRTRTTRHKKATPSRRRTPLAAATAQAQAATAADFATGRAAGAAAAAAAAATRDGGDGACEVLTVAAPTTSATPSWRLWCPVAGTVPPLMVQTLHRSSSFESGMAKLVEADQAMIVRAKSAPAICLSAADGWGFGAAVSPVAAPPAPPPSTAPPAAAQPTVTAMTSMPPPACGQAGVAGAGHMPDSLPAAAAHLPPPHAAPAAAAVVVAAPESSPVVRTPAAVVTPVSPEGRQPLLLHPHSHPHSAASQAISQWSDVPALSWSNWRQVGQGIGIVTSPGQVGTVCSKRTQHHSVGASPVACNGGAAAAAAGSTPCGGRGPAAASDAAALTATDAARLGFMVSGADVALALGSAGPSQAAAGRAAPEYLSAAPGGTPHRPTMSMTPGRRAVRSVRRLDQHEVFVAAAANFSPRPRPDATFSPPPRPGPAPAASLARAAAAAPPAVPVGPSPLISEGCGECTAEVCIVGGRGGPLSQSFSGGSPSKKPCLEGGVSSMMMATVHGGGPLALRSISSEALPTRASPPPAAGLPSAMLQNFIAHIAGARKCHSALREGDRHGGGVGANGAATAPVAPHSAPPPPPGVCEPSRRSASPPSAAGSGRARRQLVLEDPDACQHGMLTGGST